MIDEHIEKIFIPNRKEKMEVIIGATAFARVYSNIVDKHNEETANASLMSFLIALEKASGLNTLLTFEKMKEVDILSNND